MVDFRLIKGYFCSFCEFNFNYLRDSYCGFFVTKSMFSERIYLFLMEPCALFVTGLFCLSYDSLTHFTVDEYEDHVRA
jgi:hypothetical protein